MKILDNTFDKMFSFEALVYAEHCASRGKRYRQDVVEFHRNLDANLFELQAEVMSGNFHFGPYRRHWVNVPKSRTVMALPYRDRVIQWAIYNVLNPFYDALFIEDSYACRAGKCAGRAVIAPVIQKTRDGKIAMGTVSAASRVYRWVNHFSRSSKRWYCLKIDISKFFYRIDHKRLYNLLCTRILDVRLRALLWDAIEGNGEKFGLPPFTCAEDLPFDEWSSDVGIPIGNLTSQLFANIWLNQLDQYCKHTLRVHYYIRYMDDALIFVDSKSASRSMQEAIRTFLKYELLLDLNNKTCIFPVGKRRLEFVGYVIGANSVRIRKSSARRIKRAVKSIFRKHSAGILTREEVDRRVASYRGVISGCDTGNLRRRLNEIYIAQRFTATARQSDRAIRPPARNNQAAGI